MHAQTHVLAHTHGGGEAIKKKTETDTGEMGSERWAQKDRKPSTHTQHMPGIEPAAQRMEKGSIQ